MKRVLAVSDDAEFHEFLSRVCAPTGGFQVVPARDGWEAMAEQRLRPADLALLDFNAATWDAYELLSQLHQHTSYLPVVGLTWTPEVLSERRRPNAGPVRMLNRRVAPEKLLQELMAMLDGPAKGHIEGIHLGSLLQVLSWERKNCLVQVSARGHQGLLYLQRGLLIHAQCGELGAESAALTILGWEDAKLDFLPFHRVEPTIQRPLEEILLMAAQARDEGWEEAGGAGPAPEDDPFSGDNLSPFRDSTPA